MVAAVNVLVIYKYSLKTQEVSRTKFIDFEDSIHIFHNFIPNATEEVIGPRYCPSIESKVIWIQKASNLVGT